MIYVVHKFAMLKMAQFDILLFMLVLALNRVPCLGDTHTSTSVKDTIKPETLSRCAESCLAQRTCSFFAFCKRDGRHCIKRGCILLHELKEPDDKMIYYQHKAAHTPRVTGIEYSHSTRMNMKEKPPQVVDPRCIFPSGEHAGPDALFYLPLGNVQIYGYDLMKKSAFETGLAKPVAKSTIKFAVQECIMFTILFRKEITRKFFSGIGEGIVLKGFVRSLAYDTTTKRLVTLWYDNGVHVLKMSSIDGKGLKTMHTSGNIISPDINVANSQVSWKAKSSTGRYDLYYYSSYDVKRGNVKPSRLPPLKEIVKQEHECITTGAQLVRRGNKAASMIDLITKREQEFPCPEGSLIADCFDGGMNVGVACVFKHSLIDVRVFSPNGTFISSSQLHRVHYFFKGI